ncbi:MAG: hypothetical protein VX761_08230 [Planctomycetota bacterium]|nr:hypothetical protein [Planctomycetota bacterium]
MIVRRNRKNCTHFSHSQGNVYEFLWMTLAVVFVLGTVASVSAHPISLTDAVVDVRSDHVQIKLGVAIEDLVLYYELKANKEFKYPADKLREMSKVHQSFIHERLQIRGADGKLLTGSVQGMDTTQIPEGGVLQTEIKSRSISYQIKYAVAQPHRFLTIRQMFGELQPASMDCLLLHNGFLLEKARQLASGQTYTIELDWGNPPTERPDYKTFRQNKEKQLRQRLGIASYSVLYSFLYITPREVRHEILIPMLTLEKWLPLQRKDPDFLDVDEQKAAQKSLADFFGKGNPVTINGTLITPTLDRASFFGLDIRDFALNAPPRRVNVYQARVGLILNYRPSFPVRQLTVEWDTYNKYAPMLKSLVLVNDEAPFTQFFVKNAPGFEWTLAKVKRDKPQGFKDGLKAQQISQSLGKQIAGSVLRNVFTAINRDDDGEVFDALAVAVSPKLIRDIYLQIKRALIVAEQGSASLHVRDVTVQSVDIVRGDGMQITMRCRWQVTGTVEHWGHLHTRVDEFVGELTLSRERAGWMLDKFSVSEQKQQAIQTTLRYGG